MHVTHDGKRPLLLKFRSNIAPLRIETGRYESNVDILTKKQKMVYFKNKCNAIRGCV